MSDLFVTLFFAMLRGSIFLFTLAVSAAAQAYIAFDSAAASSVYSAGSFTAEEAISPGSGYWCRHFLSFCKIGFSASSRRWTFVFGKLGAAWPVCVLDGYLGLALQGGGPEN